MPKGSADCRTTARQVGFAGALWRSELVATDRAHLRCAPDCAVAHIPQRRRPELQRRLNRGTRHPHTEAWGVKVTNVEIKQVDLDHSMVRAIARQAEAERIRRAKVINAEGEQQAAQKLVEAAEILAASAGAMQLRYLGAPSEIAGEKSSTIVFPFPLDVLNAFREMGVDGKA
jgi:regulator of protease activity HflC (stomatin/prohibitin superfamily)